MSKIRVARTAMGGNVDKRSPMRKNADALAEIEASKAEAERGRRRRKQNEYERE